MKQHLKQFWLRYVLGIAIASASLLYGINPQTGKVYDPNNVDIAPINVNGKQISFTYTDDNTGENLILKCDKGVYSSWDKDTAYCAAMNISPDDQNFQIQVYHKGNSEATAIQEFLPQVPYQIDVPDYGTKSLNCTGPAVWTATTTPTSDNLYACNEQVTQCDSIAQGKCVQNNVQVGTHQETRYKDKWGTILKGAPDKNVKPTKSLTDDFKLKDQFTYWIPSGATKYFKFDLDFTHGQQGEFVINAVGSLSASGSLDPSWFSNSWTNRIPIVIDHNKVASTTGDVYTSFPVLASTTNAVLKTVTNGGHVGKDDGTDILFTLSDGTTKLNHELEKYASTTGEMLAWVNMGTGNLSTSSDTTIYAYYGNAAASDQQNVTGTWDTSYKGVWHLPNGTALTSPSPDSTSNGFNGTINSATVATGKIDGGTNVTNQNIDMGSNASLKMSTALTIEAWAKPNSVTQQTNAMIVGQEYSAPRSNPWTNYKLVVTFTSGQYRFEYSPNGTDTNLDSTISIAANTWVHLVGTYDNANARVYVNGSQTNSQVKSGATTNGASGVFRIGANGAGSEYFDGVVDEVRVSNIARSADWVKTEYNNQFSPATFETWGAEENPPVSSSSSTPVFLQFE